VGLFDKNTALRWLYVDQERGIDERAVGEEQKRKRGKDASEMLRGSKTASHDHVMTM
jgi:hypothetical protein